MNTEPILVKRDYGVIRDKAIEVKGEVFDPPMKVGKSERLMGTRIQFLDSLGRIIWETRYFEEALSEQDLVTELKGWVQQAMKALSPQNNEL